jgi:hypothetical protein
MIGFLFFESRDEKHGVMFFVQKTLKIGKNQHCALRSSSLNIISISYQSLFDIRSMYLCTNHEFCHMLVFLKLVNFRLDKYQEKGSNLQIFDLTSSV